MKYQTKKLWKDTGKISRSTPSYRAEIESVTSPPLEELKLRYGQFRKHFWDVSQRVCTVEFASCLSINTWRRCFALGDGHDVPYAQLSWLVDAWMKTLRVFTVHKFRKINLGPKVIFSRQKNIIFGANYLHGKHIQCVEAKVWDLQSKSMTLQCACNNVKIRKLLTNTFLKPALSWGFVIMLLFMTV